MAKFDIGPILNKTQPHLEQQRSQILKVKNLKRNVWGFIGLCALLSVGGVASGDMLPVKRPKPAMRIEVSHNLPVKKPGMLKAALNETLKAERMIGRVFTTLTASKRLSENDAARYANIFAFQDVADFTKADAEVAKLKDHRLMGHVLYHRYMSSDYKASYAELADWMKTYADHPNAQKVYDLAVKRKPKDATGTLATAAPKSPRGMIAQHDFDVGQLAQPYLKTRKLTPREKDIVKSIETQLSESPSTALKRLQSPEAKKLFTTTEFDALRALIAESYFYNAKTDSAFELASASADRSAQEVPKAGWIAGLSAWKKGDYATAAKYFENAAKSPRSSAWMAAASAHWAARAYLRSHQPEKVNYWLAKASEHPRTFYGIISMKALGLSEGKFNWDVPDLKDRHIRALASSAAGKRALALVDAERPDLAAVELAQINPGDNNTLKEAMIALASMPSSLPQTALRLGSTFKNEDGGLYDTALYPDVPWAPKDGYDVDRALVYAFIRQESRFNPDAQNKSSGATGLMQLMPSTAKHVAKASGDKDFDTADLKDPVTNISLGQKYLAELLKNDKVDNNLFKLAVAYNAGPGKLARWQKVANYEDDPLYFIEAIPAAETRIFVERVLTNYWIYRIKFDQDTESLDKVAEGEWPTYIAQDISRSSVFADASTFFSR